MNPIDDDFLKKMAEDREFCQEIIRTIIGDEKLLVVESRSQDTIKNLQGRSVILDAHCVLKNGAHVNVEVQKADDDDHQKRVRYNAACITANITDPGTKFKDVPTVYAIYISKNDFFKKGKTTYHVDRILRETGDTVFNGFSEIYVNACVKDGTSTAELMTIFTEDGAYDEENFPITSKRKRYFKEDEKGVAEMCKLMQEVHEEGRQEGLEETVLTMYNDGAIDSKTACKYLNCSLEQFETYKKGFNKKK